MGGDFCSVVGCHRNSTKDKGKVRFFSFPKLNKEQRELWISALKRQNEDGSRWLPSRHSKVCSDHFVSGKWSPTRGDPDYFPSKFPDLHFAPKSDEDVARFQRAQNRTAAKDYFPEYNPEDFEDEPQSRTQATQTKNDLDDLSVGGFCVTSDQVLSEVVIQTNVSKTETVTYHKSTQISSVPTKTKSCQSSASLKKDFAHEIPQDLPSTNSAFDLDPLNERQFKAFTGINKNLYNFLLDMAGSTIEDSKNIDRKAKLALFLVKLKLNPPYSALSAMFLISDSAAGRYFSEVLKALVGIAKTGVIWYTRDKIKARLPPSFRAMYPKTRVIIDCSELPCEKPRFLKQRTLLYSNYKSRHTLKFLVGCAPSGEITFISETFGGRTTDTEITVKSKFLELVEPEDVIMADKGFPHIETGVNNSGGILVMPPFKRGNRQLSSQESRSAYACASVRVHVERCIARMKKFEYLSFVKLSQFKHIDDVLYVISYLCNMGNDLINQE